MHRPHLPLMLMTVGMITASAVALAQTAPTKRIIRQPNPVATARPATPGTGPIVTRTDQPKSGRIRVDAGRIDVRPGGVLARPVVDCMAKPTVQYGEMLAGKQTTIQFAQYGNFGPPKAIAVVNGKPVYVPDMSVQNQPKPNMPRLKSLTLEYHPVGVDTKQWAMANGWYSPPEPTVSAGRIIKDNRDGTAEVVLPDAPNALFTQEATLTVVTDRCTITAPIAIRPKTHVGRWYPPALIARCMLRDGTWRTFDGASTNEYYRLESVLSSRRSIEGVLQPDILDHNCGPYGAVHEGGTPDGVGGGTGTDVYIYWDGGFDPAFSVTPITDQLRHSCVVRTERVRHPDGGGYIAASGPGGVIAPRATRSVLEVRVTWRINAPHGYCWYAMSARGRHPVSMSEKWLTRFNRNHLGVTSTMVHSPTKSEHFWAKELPDGRRDLQSATATF